MSVKRPRLALQCITKTCTRLQSTSRPHRAVPSDPISEREALSIQVGERALRVTSSSFDPSTRQKLFRTTDIPVDIRPKSVRLSDNNEAIEIEWDRPLTGRAGNPDRSHFKVDYLSRHLSPRSLRSWHSDDTAQPITWDKHSLERHNLWIPYARLKDEEVLLAAIEQLLSFGIVFFRDVPHENVSDQDCELRVLASMLGDIRRTWYGDKVWDVKSVVNAKNIAYTNLDLGLHMDLLHYENPPRFQLLHYLHSHASLVGGKSYFVDSYRAAADVQQAHPDAYATLSNVPMAFEYRNGGHWRHAERPTLQHDAQQQLWAVNYSPPFQAPLPMGSSENVEQLHRALSIFADRIESPDLRFTIQLKPGECVAFDNLRVLHARTAFSWDEQAVISSGQAGRHLKGCYVDGDSVRDRYRVLHAGMAGYSP